MQNSNYKNYKFTLEGQHQFPFLVQARYPEDVTFLTFSEFTKNPEWIEFAYECTDEEISKVFNDIKNISLPELRRLYGWITDIHIVAKLVELIPTDFIVPIEFDTCSRSCSHFEGHHRLLALRYLFDNQDFVFPVYLSGNVNFLQQYFHPINVRRLTATAVAL